VIVTAIASVTVNVSANVIVALLLLLAVVLDSGKQ
jgi:hypothetical protein